MPFIITAAIRAGLAIRKGYGPAHPMALVAPATHGK